MPNSTDWMERFEAEIEHAYRARAAGNEGKARVCARRAAGAIAEEYHKRNGYAVADSSVINHLTRLVNSPGIAPEIKILTSRFLLRVDLEHSLPDDVNLIEDAYRLKRLLLKK